jgi:hypothetical protein
MADSETALGWRAVAVHAGERVLLSFACREVNGGKVWSFAVPERRWWGDYADQDPRTAITKMMAMGGWTLEQILEPGQPTPEGLVEWKDTVAGKRARGMRANPPRLVAVTPPREWKDWPDAEGNWWMSLPGKPTRHVEVTQSTLEPGVFHVWVHGDDELEREELNGFDARFTPVEAPPECPR